MADLPKGWKQMKLGEILTPEQIAHTVQVMKSGASEIEKTRQLKEYYGQFKAQLEAKGILPEFLAYAAPHFIQQSLEAQAKAQEKEALDITQNFFKDRRN
jgi:hypothetical protein